MIKLKLISRFIMSTMPELTHEVNFSREITTRILNNSMANVIATLKFLETPACRRVLSKQTIEIQRRDATLKFKNLIVAMDSITVKTSQ